VDDQSIAKEDPGTMQTPQHAANAWLQGVANEREEVQDLIMRDLLGQEDFQEA